MPTTDVGIRLSLTGAEQSAQGVRRVTGEMDALGKAGSAVADSLKQFALVAASGFSVRAFVQAADAVTILNNQLKLATGSTQAAGKAFDALFDIAQRSRVSFTELGGTFASISRAGETLGVSQQRLLGVTEAISNAVAISGGSAESARASLVQLSQGLASGALRGDELNSVMEQTPRLAKALADGLGVSTGELRKLGEAGAITAEKVIKALEAQSGVLKGEVANSIVTVGQAYTQLTNAGIKASGELDKFTGASSTLAGTMQGLSKSVATVGEAFKENETAIKVTLGVLGGLTVAAALPYLAVAGAVKAVAVAVGLLNIAMAANPVTLALLGIGAVVGGGAAYLSQQQNSIQGMTGSIKNLAKEIEITEAKIQAAGGKTNAAQAANLAQMKARLAELQKTVQASAIGIAGNGDRELERALRKEQEAKAKTVALDKAAITAANAELKKQADLIAELNGLSASFTEDWDRLSAIYKTGKLSLEGLTEAQAALLAKQPGVKAGVDAQSGAFKDFAESQKEAAKAAEEYAKAQASAFDTAEKELESLQKSNTALALHNEEIGLTTEALNALVLSRQDAEIAALNMTIADQAGENAMGIANATLQVQIDRLNELKIARNLTATGQQKTIASDEAKKAADEWKKTAEKINDSITDALLRGFESGKGFAENLRDTVVNMFKTMVLRPVISAIVSPVAGAIATATGFSGAANAASSLSSASSIQSGLSAAFGSSSFGLGLQGTIATIAEQGFITGFGNAMTSASTLASAGSFAGAAGAAIPYVGAALAAVAVISEIASGLNGGSEYTTGTGIKGNFSGNSFTGNNYQNWQNDGSKLFGFSVGRSSSGTNTSALAPTLQNSLSQGFAAMRTETEKFSKALGIDAFQIAGFSRDISIALTADAAANKTALTKALADVGTALAGDALGFSRGLYNKTLADGTLETNDAVLARLANSLTAANAMFDDLGQGLLSVSAAGGDAASKMADLFGGLDKMSAALGSYYDNFYTAEEKRTNTLQKINKALAEVGVGSSEAALAALDRNGYRSLVDTAALSKNTEAGAKVYATLISLSAAFASVTSAAVDSTAALKKAAEDNRKAVDEATKGYFENFYTTAEKEATAQAKLAQGLQNSGALDKRKTTKLGGIFGGIEVDQIVGKFDVPKTVEQFRALVEAQDRSTASGSKAYDALILLSDAFYGIAKSAKDAALEQAQGAASTASSARQNAVGREKTGIAKSAKDAALEQAQGAASTAFSALQNAVGREKTGLAAQIDTIATSVGKLQTLAGNLKSTLDGLRIAGSDASYRVDAQAQITTALAQARAGGALPLDGQLTSALATVAKPSEQLFATFAEYAADFYATANDIAALGDLTDTQLTVEQASKKLLEAQVDRLDAILTNAQAQLDAANGNISATMGVSQALSAFSTSIQGLLSAQTTPAKAAASAAAASGTGALGGSGLAENNNAYTHPSGVVVQDGADSALVAAAKLVYQSTQGGVSTAQFDAAAAAVGGNIYAAVGYNGDPEALRAKYSFAVGTNYVPRDMVAQIHQGEMIIPKAYNPMANPGMGNSGPSNAEMIAAFKNMQAALEQITINTNKTARVQQKWDVDGLPATTTAS